MIVATAVEPDGVIGHSWGKAPTVVVAEVEAGEIRAWHEYPVGWDIAHDQGTHGTHHARVVRFLRDHGVEIVVARHVGDGMRRMLGSMGISLIDGATGDAREQIVAATGGADH